MRAARGAWWVAVLAAAVSLLLTCGAFASPGSKASRKKSSAQLRHELGSVRSQIKAKRAVIRVIKRKERSITGEIETVEGRINRTENRLEQVGSRLAFLAREKVRLEAEIDEAEKRLAGRRRVLAFRLRDSYERGRTGYIHVLLKSRSVNDYMSRAYYVERLVNSDVRLVAGIKSDEARLTAAKRLRESQAVEQRSLRDELRERKAEYRADVGRKRDLLYDVRQTREAQQEALDVLEEASRDIAARIRAMQATPRGRARMQQSWSGGFVRPASGPITSGFGMRFHPILHRSRMHAGVDIGAGYGSSIRAAAGGEVIMAGYMRGYGYTVIIDHGGGTTTLYGHCSSLLVSEGARVRQGQTIARVGSTGLSTGPHLHFEKRRNGSPVNPL